MPVDLGEDGEANNLRIFSSRGTKELDSAPSEPEGAGFLKFKIYKF